MNIALALSPLQNFRDLAGIAVSGGTVRAGLAWRCDDVSLSPPEEVADLYQRGLRKIIDLRSPSEAETTGRGPAAGFDVEYRAIPLSKAMEMPGMKTSHMLSGSTPQQIGAGYFALAVEMAQDLVQGLRELAMTDGATIFHCSAGKDRTGIFAAALLEILGATREDIVADYVKTNANVPGIMKRLAPVFMRLLGAGASTSSETGSLQIEKLIASGDPMLGAPQQAIETLLDLVYAEYGSFEALLRSRGGLTGSDVDALRAKLVEPTA